jgi:hypothetical protein
MGVTANFMDVAAESTGHQIIYMAPSVCITPAAPSPIPVPYPILTPGGTHSLDDDATKVKIQGKPVFCMESLISSCTGNEPGTQKEVVSLQTKSKAFPLTGSPNVKVQGSPVIFTTSQAMGNKM